MIAKLIGQSPEYYMLYEILRKLETITRVAPNIGWNNGTSVSELSFDATSAFYTEPQTHVRMSSGQLYGNRVIYENGKTYATWQVEGSGKVRLLTYDDRYGIGQPLGVFGSTIVAETHHEPILFVDNGRLYIAQEDNHNVAPIKFMKAQSNGEELLFDPGANTTGNDMTYPQLYKKGSVYYMSGQTANIEGGFSYNVSGSLDGTWSAPVKIADRNAAEDEEFHYPSYVFNDAGEPDEAVVVVNARCDTGAGGSSYFRKYLVRIKVVAPSTITISNWDRTNVQSGTVSVGNFDAFKYYDNGDINVVVSQSRGALDNAGNFYDCVLDGAVSKFIILLKGQASTVPTVKIIPHAFSKLIPFSTSRIYGIVNESIGGFSKPVLYKTTNLGDTWVEIGEIFPEVAANVNNCQIPGNIIEIPENQNFMIFATGTSPGYVYAKRAAWGTIQPDDPDQFYNDITAYTEAEYNALMIRSYFVEAGKITNTGTALTGLIDQSPNAANATISGSPTLDNAVTPTKATFDGVDDSAEISTAGSLLTMNSGTVIGVVKGIAAGGSHNGRSFLTATLSTGNVRFLYYQIGAPGITAFKASDDAEGGLEVNIGGTTVPTDNFHNVVFQHATRGNRDDSEVTQLLDGAPELRTPVIEEITEGQFFDDVAVNNVRICRSVRAAGSTFFNYEVKHIAIMSTAQTLTSLAKAMKYLGTKYGLTLRSPYQ